MNKSDPFEQYRINKTSPKPVVESSPENRNEQDSFEQYRIKKSESFPWIYETGRHAARIGSRIAETVGGIPGDVESLLKSGVLYGLEALGGKKLPEEARKMYTEPHFETSRGLKEKSEKASSGLTKAQSETEKTVDEAIESFAALVGPMKFRKALGVAAGSQLAKEGVKLSGLSETPQESAKLGTMVLLSAINPGGALKYASMNYDKARSLSKGASINVKNMSDNLLNLRKSLEEGVETSAKNAVMKPINDLLAKVDKNKLPIHELMSAKRDLSTIMKDPALLSRERKLLKVVGKEISSAIKPYEKINPSFGKSYRGADEIYSAVMEGTKAQDFAKKWLGAKSILGTALAETAGGYHEALAPTLASVGLAHGAARGVDFVTRLSKSNELKKYYAKGLAAAVMEDLPAMRKYEEKLNDIMEKERSE